MSETMSETIREVMLSGNGLLRWPDGEQRVSYRLMVGLDNLVGTIRIAPVPDILRRPSRHGRIFLYMPEGRRVA
ncbi:MAG: hypothetical protein JO270_19315, partial [Acidobacteriaceae bacterium]|nr:hypothetical protein [Acidobacteriaceae bacterium]